MPSPYPSTKDGLRSALLACRKDRRRLMAHLEKAHEERIKAQQELVMAQRAFETAKQELARDKQELAWSVDRLQRVVNLYKEALYLVMNEFLDPGDIAPIYHYAISLDLKRRDRAASLGEEEGTA